MRNQNQKQRRKAIAMCRVSPVDYLLADGDHAGEKRDQVEVLRGDPHQVG